MSEAHITPPEEPGHIGLTDFIGALRRHANRAAETLATYWMTRRGEDKVEHKHFKLLLDKLRLTIASTEAVQDEEALRNVFLGSSARGSTKVGALVIAQSTLSNILAYDKALAEGHPDDEEGTLTRHGLEKIQNGLSYVLSGAYQHLDQRDRRFRPNLHLDIKNNSAAKINFSLFGLWKKQVGNENLSLMDHYEYGRKDRSPD